MTAKEMPLLGQVLPTTKVLGESEHTINEFKETLKDIIKQQYVSLFEEYLNNNKS